MQTNEGVGAGAPPPSYQDVAAQPQPVVVQQPMQPMGMQGGAVQAVDQNGNPIQVVMMPAGAVMGANGMMVQSQVIQQPMQPMQQPMQMGTAQPVGTSGYPGTATTGGVPGQPGVTTTVITTTQPVVVDDPSCIYVFACFGFLIPLVGFIGMCVYNCGNGLPPRQKEAFNVMVGATIAGIIVDIILSVAT